MKDYIKLVLNNKISYLFLCLGMTITMLIISIGVTKSKEMYNLSKDTIDKNGVYSYTININTLEKINIDKVIDLLYKDITTFNVEVPVRTFRLRDYNTNNISFIIDNKRLDNPPILKGSWIGDNSDKECVIGKEVQSIDNNLSIDDSKYEVIGTVGRESIGSAYDYSIYINLINMPTVLKNDLSVGLSIILKSTDEGNVIEIDNLVNNIKNLYPEISISIVENIDVLNQSKIYLGLMSNEMNNLIKIILVAIINNIIICYFVIMSRKKEIVIRKVFGATNKKIFKQIISEFLFVNFVAICITILIQLSLNKILSSYMSVGIDFNIFAISIMLTLITTLCTIAIPIIIALNNIPVNTLKE